MKRIISYGGGVQSTTLLLLSLFDILDRADAAIFADTGWERREAYNLVRLMTDFAKNEFDFPILWTPSGDLRNKTLNPPNNFIQAPIFTKNEAGTVGQGSRRCTSNYKRKPLKRLLRETFGNSEKFELWLGISLDEMIRMKPSDVKYITFRYPLIEKRWDRAMCEEWLMDNNIPVPVKSACVGCPYHDRALWAELNEEERKDVIEVDEIIRHKHSHKTIIKTPEKRKQKVELYLYREGIPLTQAFKEFDEEKAEGVKKFGEQFNIFEKGGSLPGEEYNTQDENCGADCFL